MANLETLTREWEALWAGQYGLPQTRIDHTEQKMSNIVGRHGIEFDNKRVLDAGCGDGQALGLLRTKYNIEPYGIDISPTSLRRAHDYSNVNDLGLHLVEADVREIPFPDNAFDAVMSFGVIEHFPDYGEALREFHRVLKPGGDLILVQPHKNSLRHLKRIRMTMKNEWPYGMQINFSANRLRNELSYYGFGDIKHFVEPYDPTGPINKIDYKLHDLFPNWGYYLYMNGKKSHENI